MATSKAVTVFVELTPAQKDMTRLYWLLWLDGPKTMSELRAVLHWTTYRLDQRLYQLRKTGCVRLMERGRHVVPNGAGANRCGKWQAIRDADIGRVHG